LAWAGAGLLPGAAGWADARVLLGHAALTAAPLGAWLGYRALSIPGPRVGPGLRRAFALAALALAGLAVACCVAHFGGPRGGLAPRLWAGALACGGWLAGGLALGIFAGARVRRSGQSEEATPWRLCAALWLIGLGFQALPDRAGLGGEAWARRSPEIAARAFALAPWTIALEAAGVDWMRHPAAYTAAGTDWISGVRRGPAPLPAAALSAASGAGLLVLACLWVLAKARSPLKEWPRGPELGGSAGPGPG
jgi:hypothetical protein